MSTIKSCHDFSGALAGGIVELTSLERGTSFNATLSLAHIRLPAEAFNLTE